MHRQGRGNSLLLQCMRRLQDGGGGRTGNAVDPTLVVRRRHGVSVPPRGERRDRYDHAGKTAQVSRTKTKSQTTESGITFFVTVLEKLLLVAAEGAMRRKRKGRNTPPCCTGKKVKHSHRRKHTVKSSKLSYSPSRKGSSGGREGFTTSGRVTEGGKSVRQCEYTGKHGAIGGQTSPLTCSLGERKRKEKARKSLILLPRKRCTSSL